jgi:uncharacterized protein with NRDE domain
MCLIAWSWQPASATPLLLAANRDEFYARPAQSLHWWDGGQVLAGKDTQAGGTWLGLTRAGRLAALTNYRDFSRTGKAFHLPADAPSRGELVPEFLNSDLSAYEFLQRLKHRSAHYNGFNLLVFDGTQLLGLQSRHAEVVVMQPGIGAVSNADFHSPWPKLVWLRGELENLLGGGVHSSIDGGSANSVDAEALLSVLKNDVVAPDGALPQTGLPLARERALSAAFIVSPDYGTRASSVVRIGRAQAEFVERSFGLHGDLGTQRHSFSIGAGA